MVLDAAALRQCKLYCKVDEDDDDGTQMVRMLMETGVEYLQGAGIADTQANHARYRLALWGLVLHWYDGGETVGGTDQLPAGTRAIINGLKNAPDSAVEAAT